jgi:hypothetical protein
MVVVAEVTKILGGLAVLKRPVRSAADLEQVVDEGLPKAALDRTLSAAFPDINAGCPSISILK